MNAQAGGLNGLASRYRQNRYKVLFYTILLALVSSPVLSALKFNGLVIELLLATSLFAAIVPAVSARSRPYLLAGMFFVWIARPLGVWLEQPVLSAAALGIWVAVGLLAMAAALRFAMRARLVDAEHLYAALSAYLMAGVYFGLLYWVIEQVVPGTFAAPTRFSQTSALYFSFVTLATLGYGDVVPRGDIARGVAIVEGVGGQLFLAVLVARLVSLYSRPSGDQTDQAN